METPRGGRFAVKKLFIRKPSARERTHDAAREARILNSLSHENIVPVYHAVWERTSVHLVMPALPADLADAIDACVALLPEAVVKSMVYMLLKGLAYLHSRDVAHRDVKPSNLLLTAAGALQIADFGLARHMPRDGCERYFASRGLPRWTGSGDEIKRLEIMSPSAAATGLSCCVRGAGVRSDCDSESAAVRAPEAESSQDLALTNQVASRWYRAPEVLLGSAAYDFGVDVWAAGCVMAELIELSPLVPGASDLEQIFRVLQARGTPSREEWPGMEALPDASKLVLPTLPKPSLAALLPNASPSALDLLEGLLCYDPDRRLGAAEALEHTWFRQAPLPAPLSEVAAVVLQAIRHKEAAAASRTAVFDDALFDTAIELALGDTSGPEDT